VRPGREACGEAEAAAGLGRGRHVEGS
jgi:hypothetical protein